MSELEPRQEFTAICKTPLRVHVGTPYATWKKCDWKQEGYLTENEANKALEKHILEAHPDYQNDPGYVVSS